MFPLLAEMNWTAPAGFAVWIACAAFAMILVNQAFKLANNVRGRQPQQIAPQPFEVKAAQEFAGKKEFEEHKGSNQRTHNEIFSTIRQTAEKLQHALKEETDKLDNKINRVSEQNAAQTAKLELVSQRQVQMDGKIDRLLERANSSLR